MTKCSKHRILVITQYIYPEPFKSSEMVFELAKRGYEVEVLTGIPNYPEGHYYSGYGLFNKRKEIVNGVTFYRCLQTPRKFLPGFIGQALNYLTFAFNATLYVFFFFAWRKRYDSIIAHEPSPITQIIPACILGLLHKVPVYSWIQDIWPDSVVSAAGEKWQWLVPILNRVTNWIYRHSTKLLITSKGMISLINRDADYTDKIILYPQWAEDMKIYITQFPPHVENVKTDSFTIMMVGTLNSAIGVPSILALCEEMKDDPVSFVFVGGGSEEQTMRDIVSTKHLKNVCFTGRRKSSEMPYYFAQADAMLLTLKPTSMLHLDITIPARLQAYMSAGKPILAMIGSGAADIINEADCGYAVTAGDYKALAKVIRENVLNCTELNIQKGINARRYYEKYFTKEKCIDNLCDIINNEEK
ncbi:MAG: glycosyltransferase family 4 protein [Paludibacteraceae bacterium]|nr:glycosyltransferase family 4 protein [Paludibacteraceae bacterium]